MISDARGNHVSPGIYTEEKDVTYSVKSLGITSLALVGETLYGPAFENIEIQNWSEFVDYFGGTSTEKFRGSGLPKYELPYIAKSYLEESKRLNVVRVLGLSGYHAGPFWAVKDDKGTPIVIIRSKMAYGANGGNICSAATDNASAIVKNVVIKAYEESIYTSECAETGEVTTISGDTNFQLNVVCNDGYGYNTEYKYNVTLDPSHPNYIYNVLSNRPDTGTTPIYVEAVYEGALNGKIDISSMITGSNESVKEIIYFEVGKETELKDDTGVTTGYSYNLKLTNGENAKSPKQIEGLTKETTTYSATTSLGDVKYISSEIETSTNAYDDYLEGYRAAQTPWIVSDASVNAESKTATMRKLFRFITISDGNAANYQVKVSIQNIKPEDGTFDVVVRDFYDTDAAPIILERFSKCNLVEGDAGYIAYKIGTSDGGFVAKSKYILVEMADTEDLRNNVPAGFLGYPIPSYGATGNPINMKYNTLYNPQIKAKKQYFGISDITGIDVDMLSYKGRLFYDGSVIRNGFHMDSSIGSATNVYVDGVSGYKFTSVSDKKVTATQYAPRLINAAYIDKTLYADIKTRKFTVCFYGGFDGWDVNRAERTNTDNYKASRYSMEGSSAFTRVIDQNGLNLPLNLPSTAITSDYYAYLAGYRVFANPQDVDINVFATPGINWYDHTLLTEEAIDVIEDTDDGRGGDALYIMASPKGMDASELAQEFDAKEINSSYACTYAPWVMYYDASNKRYLDLPVTKDVVRNMAATDNNSYPWFAPAGIERGNVNCVKAEYKTTLADEDELYENRVNPVKSFAQDGVKIWGNKTAYTVDSPLNRINVRRLMIRVKKLVTNAAKNLIFTQYDDTLEKQFRGLIDPILADVKANRGISDYRILTEVTPETRDQHILPAKILIKPTPSLEYISISFVVYPESVSFDEN